MLPSVAGPRNDSDGDREPARTRHDSRPPHDPARKDGASAGLSPEKHDAEDPSDSSSDPGQRTDDRVPWEAGHLVSGRYEIERPLGGGSMGQVFLAEDRLLKKPVALKVLRPELAQRRDTVRRFLREVALAHSVTHQNVVRIYDTGEDQGLPFFTMEVLQGQVLEDLFEGPDGHRPPTAERLSIKKIRAIAFNVLDGMEAAHLAGVVHRDLKPGNVMLTHRGAIVMDFGVAGIDDVLDRSKIPEATASPWSLVRTEAGTIFGSPAYMAPELWEGQPASVQSDLYAFGVMLYQMITGRLPHSAKTPAAFVEKLASAPPPPLRSLRRDVPWSLVRLVRRCMARDIEERPLSASAAANLISPLRNQHRRRFVVGAGLLAAAVVGALWMRTAPSWRSLGLPDTLAEAELSAAIRAFDVGERGAALRRLERLSIRAPDSAALTFWRATVLHDLGDPDGRRASCNGRTTLRGSPSWQELAQGACESPYRLAAPAEQTLRDGPRSIGPELLPLAVQWHLIPRLDLDPQDPEAVADADAALASLSEEQDLQAMWALPMRTQLARTHLADAMTAGGGARVPRPAPATDTDLDIPLLLEVRTLRALLDGDMSTAAGLAERLRPVDPTMALRIQMHDGRLAAAWKGIEALGDDPHRVALVTMWCGYALRFEMTTRPRQCADLAPGLTRSLWDVFEHQQGDTGLLPETSIAMVERFGAVAAGRCGGGDTRPPRVRQVVPPFEMFAAELELTAALCPASPAVTDLVRGHSLAMALSTLSPNDPWLLIARARVDDASGHDKLAEAKRLAASELWARADPDLPLTARLRSSLGIAGADAPTLAGRDR